MYEMDKSTMRKGLKFVFHSILNKLRVKNHLLNTTSADFI